MRSLIALAAATGTALVAVAAPAHAAVCGGTTGTAVVCAHPENVDPDPYGGPTAGDCFFLLDDECTPVYVPTPSFTSGPLVSTP